MHCPKRTISLVLSVLLLMCFSYSFADSAVTYDAGQRSIHVSYNGCSSNEQYMLFFY